MKKYFLLLIILGSLEVSAQIEVTPFGGWLWTAAVPMYNYPGYYPSQNAKVDDKGNFGVRLGGEIRFMYDVEFEWNHKSSATKIRPIGQRKKNAKRKEMVLLMCMSSAIANFCTY